MAFGGGGDRTPFSNLNPGTGGNRNAIKPHHDEISHQAQHTADLERDEAEGRKGLPSRIIGRLRATLRGLF